MGECTKTSSDTGTIGQCGESTGHDGNMDYLGEQYHKQGVSIKRPAPTNQQQKKKREHPMNLRAIAQTCFSAHGEK